MKLRCLLAIACVSLALLASCSRSKPRLLVVGDSVTFVSGESIKGALGTSNNLEVVGLPFYRSIDLVKPLQEADGGKNRVVVLAGYNDIRRGTDKGPGIEELVKETVGFKCSVFLTLPTGSLDSQAVQRWNARLEALGKKYGVHTSDAWKTAVDADSNKVLVDGIHPNAAGQKMLAQSMKKALQEEC